jgi:WD40 repeat protein
VLKGHTDYVTFIAITSDSKYIVSGSCDKTVRLWNIKEKLCEAVFTHPFSIGCVAINDTHIVSGSETVRIWNIKEKRQEAILVGHHNSIICVAITRDDKYIASGSYDMSIRIWNVKKNDKKLF